MNRTLLLIICDFLLLNLLALTRWDNQEPGPSRESPAAALAATAPRTAQDDLVASLREVLADERVKREKISEQLRSDVAARDASVAELAKQRADLEGERRQLEASLAETRQAATRLDTELASATRQAGETQKQLLQTQSRLSEAEKARDTLQSSVKATEADRQRLSERLAVERAEAQRQQAELERQRKLAETLAKAKQEAEKQVSTLVSEVKVAEAEKKLLQQNATDLRQQVVQTREEKERIQAQAGVLAQGVKQLAKNTDELKTEIRENTPITGNQLFAEFLTNRVLVTVSGLASGLFGQSAKTKEAVTVLAADGGKIVALMHVNEAPFSLNIPGFGLDGLTSRVSLHGTTLPSGTPYFLGADPRVIGFPVAGGKVSELGIKVYPLAKSPFKFAEAVLVSRGGKYYGEVEFKLDPRLPQFVRMKTRFLSRLFGEFSPSPGDLVLSKTGELLGVMVNGEYCAVLSSLQPAPGGELTPGMTREDMGHKLETFRAQLDRLTPALR